MSAQPTPASPSASRTAARPWPCQSGRGVPTERVHADADDADLRSLLVASLPARTRRSRRRAVTRSGPHRQQRRAASAGRSRARSGSPTSRDSTITSPRSTYPTPYGVKPDVGHAVRRLRFEGLHGPGPQRAAVGELDRRHVGPSALRAARLHRKRDGAAVRRTGTGETRRIEQRQTAWGPRWSRVMTLCRPRLPEPRLVAALDLATSLG